MEHGYVAIIETAIRVKDIDLITAAINDAKIKGTALSFGKVKSGKLTQLMRIAILNIMSKLIVRMEREEI